MEMNPQIMAAIRNALLVGGGFIVSRGVVDSSTMTQIVGGVMAVVPYAWSLWGHRPAGIIAAAASLPEVHKIVTTPEIAHSPKFAENSSVITVQEDMIRK